MYCDVVNVQPRFNFSDNKVILNLQCWVDILGTAGVQCTACILSAHQKIFVHGLPWLLALLLYYIDLIEEQNKSNSVECSSSKLAPWNGTQRSQIYVFT